MKTIILPILLLSVLSFAQQLTIDSVTVDSVWNSDSRGIVQRDLKVSFVPNGNMAKVWAKLQVSFDGGNHFTDSITVLNKGLDSLIQIGQRRTVVARIIGGDRQNVVVKANCKFPIPTMINIVGGTFQMGDSIYATPIHSVTVSAFKMSSTEITQELYTAVMGTNSSYFGGDTSALRPVETVSWYDAALFCNALSKLMGKDTVYSYTGSSMGSDVAVTFAKNGYRLPTEAEWEYAYRAGTTTNYYWSNTWDTTTANRYCWSYNNSNLGSGRSTQQVGTKLPNAWGLYDMAGNVWEWCNDWYGSYTSGSKTDPTGATTGSDRVLRGGSWTYDSGYNFRTGVRYDLTPGSRINNDGFRVVCR